MKIENLEKLGTIIDASAAIIIGAIILYLIAWQLALYGIPEWIPPFSITIIAVLVAIYRLIGLLPWDNNPVIIRPIYNAKFRKEFKGFGKLPVNKAIFLEHN